MKSKDCIQRFLFNNAAIRGEIIHLNQSFQTIIAQHDYPSSLHPLLGEALVISCLLSAIIKIKGRLTVQFQSKHALKLLLAQCYHQTNIRGLAQWEEPLSTHGIQHALATGTLAIMINPDANTTTYKSIVPWQGTSFAESVEMYFRDSEQLPTRIWLAVNEKTAAGLLIQKMPVEQKPIANIANDEQWEKIISLTNTVSSEELLSLDHTTLLKRLYVLEEEVTLYSPTHVHFNCTCSVERGENAIRMLGKKEAEEELKNKHTIIITCEFCNRTYEFNQTAVEALFRSH